MSSEVPRASPTRIGGHGSREDRWTTTVETLSQDLTRHEPLAGRITLSEVGGGGLERTLLFAFQCSIALTNSTIAAVFVMLAFADLEEECNVMIEHWQSIHSPCIKRCGVEGFVWLLGGIAACNIFKQRSPHYMIATPLIRPLQWKGMKRFFREVNIQWWLGFKSSLLCLVKPRFLRAWNRAMVFHRRLWRPWSLCSERVLI